MEYQDYEAKLNYYAEKDHVELVTIIKQLGWRLDQQLEKLIVLCDKLLEEDYREFSTVKRVFLWKTINKPLKNALINIHSFCKPFPQCCLKPCLIC